MIVIFEPQCKEITHEKVNSGFIYGVRLAFPNDKILFYAHKTHITAIKNILKYDNIIIENIEYFPIRISDSLSLIGMINYYLLFKKIFSFLIQNKIDNILFLSFSPTLLYLIKKIKSHKKFIKLKFILVLHGDFENISNENNQFAPPLIIKKAIFYRIRCIKLKDIPFKIFIFIKNKFIEFNYIKKYWQLLIVKYFQTKAMILWNNSNDFKYIALSPHIIKNAEKYIDVKSLNIKTLILPMVFAKPIPRPINNYVRFATFGYGNSTALQNLLFKLAKEKITQPYEIRIIGMDNRGTEGFQNVTCSSPGRRLARSEMEKQAKDIDIFLILHDKNRYKLSCSNSILESISYMKPILHFNNDCINHFNNPNLPIGICCDSEQSLVNTMVDIIENYTQFQNKSLYFRENINILRENISIKNSIEIFKSCYQ